MNPTSPEACVRSALRIQMAKGPGKRALLAAAPAKHGRCALLPLHLRWRVRHRLLLHGQLRGCLWRESVVRARFCHGKPTVTREASVQIKVLFFCEPHSVCWKCLKPIHLNECTIQMCLYYIHHPCIGISLLDTSCMRSTYIIVKYSAYAHMQV